MRFSIVTPSFRGGDWLSLCAASVADQGVDLEHLVQEGGFSEARPVQNLGPLVKLVAEQDAGMYDAINRALRRSRGELLGFLNCDEQYLPGALSAVDHFFRGHPDIDVLFGNVVVVDVDGQYLWHRKMLTPALSHTWTCPLTTLTCGTFFRRSILERGLGWFDAQWKVCGDSVWMLNLLKHRAPMQTLGQFTSAFAHTGSNLSLDPRAALEAQSYHATAPFFLRVFRPAILLHHRFRRLLNGIYRQAPFDFEIYTRKSPTLRVRQHVPHPTSRWRWQAASGQAR